MRSIKGLLIFLLIPFLFVSCEKDNFHKAELRCYMDNKLCIIPDELPVEKSITEAKAVFDKQAMELTIQGSVADKDGEIYDLYLHIKPFVGAGNYPVSMMSGFVATPQSNANMAFTNYYDIDSTYEASVNVTNYVEGKTVGGYFHFVGTGDLCGGHVFVSNGRFSLKAGT